ncbi:MAG: hypothetical protein AUI14_17300 [Actinobacteria bacterium 13_2_20CM_2_71_6]|nr:MAG: hypothetical protein AUI14_17300 [Actinobacteria bacterium 13_2_20CM_2_71_6]
MWWAGVAWRGSDFEALVVDDEGREVVPTTTFSGTHTAQLIELLAKYAADEGAGLGTVIDSTNGVLDGHLLALGLDVYRADPWSLPGRPAFGSVPARDLVDCARTDFPALSKLTISDGTLTGRVEEYLAGLARSAEIEPELIRTGQCFHRGSAQLPEIALTFDDGPHPAFTPQVLEILRRYGAVATFFCVGLNVSGYPHLVRRTVDEGHLVANHTWSHPYLPDLTRDELLRQIDATNDALRRATGRPSTLVRPPYGGRTPEVLGWLAGHGVTTVLWDIDASDWAVPGTDTIVARASQAAEGSVILMHDAGGDRTQTIAALPRILEHLGERGYQFVTLDKLIAG